MRYVRFLLVPMLLLSMAVPAFAICGYCDELGNCQAQQGLYSRCRYKAMSNCTVLCIEESAPLCDGSGGETQASFSSGYRIKSVTVEDSKAAVVKQNPTVVVPAKVKKTI